MGKQHRPRQTAANYVTRELPVKDLDQEPLDMSYCDNDDGTVTARFDDIPGVYITADTLPLCLAFVQQVSKVIQGKMAEDIRDIKTRTDGDMHGALSLADLEPRGIQTRLIDGAYCTRLTGMPGAMFMCDDADALGALFGMMLQIAMAGYRHDRREMH